MINHFFICVYITLQVGIYHNILNADEILNKRYKSINFDVNTKSLLSKLLVKIPSLRLGMLRCGVDDVWEQPFFRGMYKMKP